MCNHYKMYTYVYINIESRTLWQCTFFLLFFNTIIDHLLRSMKMCSWPLERRYCLKKCPLYLS